MFDDNKNKEVENGIYKIAQPFRIKIEDWINDKDNSGYAVIGTNYSKDYEECDVIYYTSSKYGQLGKLVEKLNVDSTREYGYIQSVYGINVINRLGGVVIGV